MEVRLDRTVAFDFCVDHGLWLDRGEREAFEGVLGPLPGP
jgi:hypothetical protein